MVLACGTLGALLMLAATSVSFLEDQGAAQDAAARRNNYYERAESAPGRPVIRYALTYVPFVRAIGSPQWTRAIEVGRGPDYLPYHLARLRHTARSGGEIPAWFPWLLAGAPLALLLWSGIRLRQGAAAPASRHPADDAVALLGSM
jgi:hypothetical protein